MNKDAKSAAVFATAWLCTAATSRLQLDATAFTRLDLACGSVPALMRPVNAANSPKREAQTKLFDFITGPATHVLLTANPICVAIRLQVGVTEIYELRVVPRPMQTTDPRAHTPPSVSAVRVAARCALRALQCYTDTLEHENDVNAMRTSIILLDHSDLQTTCDLPTKLVADDRKTYCRLQQSDPCRIDGLVRVMLSEVHLTSHNIYCCTYTDRR
jgi:hypothetical protein